MSSLKATTISGNDVVHFVPNYIGYARVACALASFILMTLDTCWLLATALYLSNFVGDLFDGLAARKLDQCSTYGSVLDMVTDRCSTLGLLFILSVEYSEIDASMNAPWFRLAFLALVLLDISSHWVQTYSALSTGHHHKSEAGNKGRSFLVRWFYQYYYFFGYLCVGTEFTYVSLYVRKKLMENEGHDWIQQALDLFLYICIPGCIAKQFVNVAQLTSGFSAIAAHDAEQINNKRKAS